MKRDSLFDGAAALLPERLRATARYLPEDIQSKAEELRIHCGGGAYIITDTVDYALAHGVTVDEIEETLERATGSSLHTAQDSLRSGFLTAPGGYRIGVTGTAVIKSGEVIAFREISSLCLRIPRQHHCVSEELLSQLQTGNVLILSPPGGGKTSFLRELVRLLSVAGTRVALVDERSELAAMQNGVPHLDVGPNTDVMALCPKTEAIPLLLRSMSPQVIALDELTGDRDLQIVGQAVGCGVRILATAHAASVGDLHRSGFLTTAFDTAVLIRRREGSRYYETEVLS